jgi:hypothetical protein
MHILLLAALLLFALLDGEQADAAPYKAVHIFPESGDRRLAAELIEKAWSASCNGQVDKFCGSKALYEATILLTPAGCVGDFDDGQSPLTQSKFLHHVEFRCNGQSVVTDSAY